MTKFIGYVFLAMFLISLLIFGWSFIRYPEIYISTWRYQLEQDVKCGDEEAVKYYETHYLSNGVELF